MRACGKCGEKMVVNEDIGLMECISGKHIEPINTKLPQWWVDCKKTDGGCGQKFLVTRKQMPRWQKKIGNRPVFEDGKFTFENNPNQQPSQCKSCGRQFLIAPAPPTVGKKED